VTVIRAVRGPASGHVVGFEAIVVLGRDGGGESSDRELTARVRRRSAGFRSPNEALRV
jgi:hypothetical protein